MTFSNHEAKQRLAQLLRENSVSEVAKMVGVSRNTLYSRAADLGVEMPGRKGRCGRKKKQLILK